jgi:SAM-dependent methyltransferase
MEHFNFNPVGFVRDLHRVLKPGGRAFITVPNIAKLENRIRLLLGKDIGVSADTFNKYYNYAGGRFLGFHWHEYTLPELNRLFVTGNFSTVSAGHVLTYQNYPYLSPARKLERLFGRLVFSVVPSVGNLCAIVAEKPA